LLSTRAEGEEDVADKRDFGERGDVRRGLFEGDNRGLGDDLLVKFLQPQRFRSKEHSPSTATALTGVVVHSLSTKEMSSRAIDPTLASPQMPSMTTWKGLEGGFLSEGVSPDSSLT
jgi:hypothetical protein